MDDKPGNSSTVINVRIVCALMVALCGGLLSGSYILKNGVILYLLAGELAVGFWIWCYATWTRGSVGENGSGYKINERAVNVLFVVSVFLLAATLRVDCVWWSFLLWVPAALSVILAARLWGIKRNTRKGKKFGKASGSSLRRVRGRSK